MVKHKKHSLCVPRTDSQIL